MPKSDDIQAISPYVTPTKNDNKNLSDNSFIDENAIDLIEFEANILCDADAFDSFDTEENSGTKLSLAVKKRNDALVENTGASITATATENLYQTACNDILSGTNNYNLYAGNAVKSLLPLFTEGYLHDVSDSEYIDTQNEWYHRNVMDELAFYGKQYLIPSYATEVLQDAKVLVFNRDAMPKLEKTISEIATHGELTFKSILSYCKTAYYEHNSGDLFYGVSYSDSDILPMYFGLGGSYLHTDTENVTAFPLSQMNTLLDSISSFVESEYSYNCNILGKIPSLLYVARLSDIPMLRQNGNVGILPLPKASAECSYTSYIDLASATMLAIPENATDKEKLEYFTDRLAYHSYEHMKPYYTSLFASDNTDDKEITELIFAGATSSIDALFGYGGIDELLATEVHEGDAQFTIKYYERKALYDKALSIIKKRFESQ